MLRNNSFFTDHATNLYMLNAVFYSITTIVLTGVTVAAPLQSLSLHAAQDHFLDIWCQIRQAPCQYEHFMQYCRTQLRRLHARYKIANALFFPIWLSAITLLFCELILLTGFFMEEHVLFYEGMFFLTVSVIVCALFGFLSYGLFSRIQPGKIKLDMFLWIMAPAQEAQLKHPQLLEPQSDKWTRFLERVSVFVFGVKPWSPDVAVEEFRPTGPFRSLHRFGLLPILGVIAASIGFYLFVTWFYSTHPKRPLFVENPVIHTGLNGIYKPIYKPNDITLSSVSSGASNLLHMRTTSNHAALTHFAGTLDDLKRAMMEQTRVMRAIHDQLAGTNAPPRTPNWE